jgi:SHS2 domain-containing protein
LRSKNESRTDKGFDFGCEGQANIRWLVAEKDYELIEHTADIGIRVEGSELKDVFSKAAGAMFDIMAQRKGAVLALRRKVKIEQSASDLQELFVNWLNELLSLSATGKVIFYGFTIEQLTDNHIIATATGQSYNCYKVNIEIKAATYHQLKIGRAETGWRAEVIFDV